MHDQFVDIGQPSPKEGLPRSGSLIDVSSVRHRLLGTCAHRVILTDLRTHHPWLIQDADGSIQLPTIDRVLQMLQGGEAKRVADGGSDPSPTARMLVQIEMLDAANVRQGDKAIWLFFAKAWTPDLVQRFGPFDDPWRIRRWRADLRRAAK